MNNTTLLHDPSEHHDSLTENLRDRGFPIAGMPEAPRDEPDEPDEAQQGELPTGPTHVVARRSKDELASAKAFIASAGKVKFDRGRATLRGVWMAVAYYASLGAGPERVCFAQVKTLADRALVSERTIRTHLATLAGHGLIQTKYRGGGHTPTHWKVSALSPFVLGGENCRAGRQELPGRAARIAGEVIDRSLAATQPELLAIASKQQPDGACAPPAAAQKDPPQQTKKEQKQTDEPTEALAPGKTDTGGETRGGITEKQIKFLRMLADRVGADYAEDLWRAADRTRLQAQIKAAIPFKDRGVEHTHAARDEAIFRVGVRNKIGFKEGVQRCACGSVRAAIIDRAGEATELSPWTLSGYTDDAEALDGRWAAPMTFSDVKHLYNTLPGDTRPSGVDDARDVPADWDRVAAEAREKALVAAEAKEKAQAEKALVAREAREKARESAKDKEWRVVAAEGQAQVEKARVAREAKDVTQIPRASGRKEWRVSADGRMTLIVPSRERANV